MTENRKSNIWTRSEDLSDMWRVRLKSSAQRDDKSLSSRGIISLLLECSLILFRKIGTWNYVWVDWQVESQSKVTNRPDVCHIICLSGNKMTYASNYDKLQGWITTCWSSKLGWRLRTRHQLKFWSTSRRGGQTREVLRGQEIAPGLGEIKWLVSSLTSVTLPQRIFTVRYLGLNLVLPQKWHPYERAAHDVSSFIFFLARL